MCSPSCLAFGRSQLGADEVAGKRVLEVGSLDVNGSLRRVVEALEPQSYTGVDLWPGPGVDEVCSAERLLDRFGAGRFDVVLSTETLEHVFDWRAAVTGMKGVLRPGGVVLVTTRAPGFPFHGHPADFWRFEPEVLEAAFADFDIAALERDPLMPGVFLKAKKRENGAAVDLGAIEAVRVAQPPRRRTAFQHVWRGTTRALTRVPLGLRSSRQLARESLTAGAIQKVPELARLVALVRAQRPRAVVEIGSYRGGTLAAWCKLATPDAVLVSVDLPAEYGTPASPDDLRRLARRGQRLEVVRGDSHADETRRQVEEALDGRAVDFLMIDGDHTYEGVKRDFELYSPLVRDGGLVAFHDVLPHPNMPGVEVDRLWRELRERYEHDEFVEPGHDLGFGEWGGIGVLRYRAE
ncbi:MAG: class I SAM-dependent methyltransferase [Actinomycetota bacterium]|nr:class I SAM-dependent methyltransferase [Actinomycetota bacterium]